MADKVQHTFHGKLEQVQNADLPAMGTQMIESIEMIVFVLLIFTVFFKFKNMVDVNTYRKTPQNAEPTGLDGKEKQSITFPSHSKMS